MLIPDFLGSAAAVETVAAARPEVADPLVTRFAELLAAEGVSVASGVFGARMLVEIENDGPVTLILER